MPTGSTAAQTQGAAPVRKRSFISVLGPVLLAGIAFAVVPLVYATSKRTLMADYWNSPVLATAGWASAGVVVVLNAGLLVMVVLSVGWGW